MTIEEKLKELILTQYKSVREFVQVADMPYSSVDSMFRRGIHNSSVSNVIKLCNALKISTDELAQGRIVPVEAGTKTKLPVMDLDSALDYIRMNSHDFADLSVDGKVLTKDE